MKSHVPTLPLILLTLAAAVDASAEDHVAGAATGESWFGVDGSAASTQEAASRTPHVTEPRPTASEGATSVAQGNETSARHSSSLAHARYPVSQSSPVRYEPDDPSVHLLVQNGAMPYDSLVPYNAPGWWGWPHPYGYYREAGTAPIYSPVCEAPCMTRVSRGPHQFALSRPGGSIVPVVGASIISEPSLIQAHYVDRSTQRTAGVLIGIVGAISGFVMIAASVRDEQHCAGNTCYTTSKPDEGWSVAGLGVIVGSIVASVVLLEQSDEAQLSISPLRLAPPDPTHDVLQSSWRGLSPQGLSATLLF